MARASGHCRKSCSLACVIGCEEESMMQTPTGSDEASPAMEGSDGAAQAASRAADMGRRAAHTTAEAMQKTADYVREQDLESMFTDLQQLLKRNPGITLLAAAAVGFLLGRTFSRD